MVGFPRVSSSVRVGSNLADGNSRHTLRTTINLHRAIEEGLMSVRRGIALAALATIGALLTFLIGSTAATAAPAAAPSSTSPGSYPPGSGPTVSLNKSTARAGTDVTVSGHGFTPGSVALTLHTAVKSLGTATADSKGNFSQSVTLPGSETGHHQICGTNSAGTACADITITDRGAGGENNGPGGGTGGVSNTGVAVMSIGGIGVLLVIAGGFMLFAGRRTQAHA
jgi:hypothetical protein